MKNAVVLPGCFCAMWEEERDVLQARLNYFLDFLGFLQAKLIQFFTFIFGSKKIEAAFISDIRYIKSGDEKKDARLFGFNFRKFRVLPWIQYKFKTKEGVIRGQLFMIGIKSNQVFKQRHEAQKLFLEAVERAVKKGAKVILLAANTKHIFGKGKAATDRLAELYPAVIFTLGDNLTAGFIDQRITQFFGETGLRPETANVLVAAPRGLLGESSVSFLKKTLGCKNVWCLFNPETSGWEEAEKRGKEIGFTPVFSYQDITSRIDMAITCGSDYCYELTPEIIEKIGYSDRRLIVIDPSEPPNLKQKTLEKCRCDIIYHKAGNGFNPNLKYVLGVWAANVLGMKPGLFWGCFSETFCIAYALLMLKEDVEEIKKDLFAVSEEKIKKTLEWAEKAGFSLPRV